MKKVVVPDNQVELTLKDICERCLVRAEQVISLVEYGVVEPEGAGYAEWRFSTRSYLRIRKALRLQQDLSINEPGVAMVVELLDRLESANQEIKFLKKQIGVRETGQNPRSRKK